MPSCAVIGPVNGLPPASSFAAAAAMSALVSSVTLGPNAEATNGFSPLAMVAR